MLPPKHLRLDASAFAALNEDRDATAQLAPLTSQSCARESMPCERAMA
jgi:hypothetical protein